MDGSLNIPGVPKWLCQTKECYRGHCGKELKNEPWRLQSHFCLKVDYFEFLSGNLFGKNCNEE